LVLNVIAAEGYRRKKAYFVCDHLPRFAVQFTTTLGGRYRLLSAEPAEAILAS
jgi:hypothetical protein